MQDALPITSELHLLLAIHTVREQLRIRSISEMERQMVIVSASELCRNILDHAGARGTFRCEFSDATICLTATDNGPGIKDLEKTIVGNGGSARGLGLGLAGVHRLMDSVHITTSTEGTVIVARKRIRTSASTGQRR